MLNLFRRRSETRDPAQVGTTLHTSGRDHILNATARATSQDIVMVRMANEIDRILQLPVGVLFSGMLGHGNRV
jgi:hypothetical protein